MYLLRATLLRSNCSSLQNTAQLRHVKRWVAPTLRELNKRQKQLAASTATPQPRAGFIEWNYRAELFAFGKRLQEQFQLPLLQTAFTQRAYVLQQQQRQQELGVEVQHIDMSDNVDLSAQGAALAQQYVQAYLQHALPKVPAAGQQAIAQHLLSSSSLAHIALHLGMKDLLFDAEYPPAEAALAQSLLAVIAALAQSSGVPRAFLFVRDFICTQLNQRDLLELWPIEEPEAMLRQLCKEQNLAEPEPRLLGDCGKNTVLAAYHVGVYSNKKLLGQGFGEDIPTAIETACLNALQRIFGIQDHMRPFDFQLQVEPKQAKLTTQQQT